MLPLQITLEGFLSYREPTTISFEGAPLWMLAGENGAGKSSVFDAMRWTLFGAHRGGKSGHEALIHHGQPRLRVAFDLGLGESRFRLIRTLARAGRATWQIEEVFGDDTLKVPETDGRDGYEKWVRERIGLSDETFCTAMYLAQNRGDAILGASPQQRYDMLAEIVDISAYAALHERAKTRASELEIASKAAERSWQLAPEAEPGLIRETGEKLQVLSAQIEANRARRERLLGLEPLCTQWQNWERERAEKQTALEQARQLLSDGAQIERDFARAGELETLLPPLEHYVEARGRAAQNAGEIAAVNLALGTERAQLQILQADSEKWQAEVGNLEWAQQNAEQARNQARDEGAALAPRLALARQVRAFGTEIADLETGLRAFPIDLAEQKIGLEDRITNAQENAAARAILVRFAREKAAFRDAQAREIAASDAVASGRASLPRLEAQVEARRLEWEAARESQTGAVELLAAARARARDAREALARFESVPAGSDCFFCGQKLTPEHRHKERARLELASRNSRSEEEAAQEALGIATQGEKSAQQGFETAQKSLRKAAGALESAGNDTGSAQVAAASAATRAAEVWGELAVSWQARFEGIKAPEAGLTWGSNPQTAATVARLEVGVSPALATEPQSATAFNGSNSDRARRALESDFPTPPDLETPADEAQTLANWRLELARVTKLESERREVAARLRDRENQLAPGLESLGGEDLDALFARETAVKAALEAATRALEANRAPLAAAREKQAEVAAQIDAARAAIAGAELKLAGLQAAQTEIARALDALKTAATSPFESLGEADLRARLEALQSELTALKRGDLAARIAQLRAAQTRAQELESEVAALERALQSVPLEARRAPQELQEEAAALVNALETDGEVQKRLQLEFNRLEERRDEKARLESALFEAQNRAREQKTLADLLGPHELQRFLLREAELGIIDEANAVLDRISGGDLRLELRADEAELAGARKGQAKVLDVAIFRSDEFESRAPGERGSGERGSGERGSGERGSGERGSGERGSGMLPAFLSGSQRFRVAVSLALGIGRYATRGGGSRLEAVIIDEGFGALDKIGRGEMIEELQSLGQELKRVILVSHQEEFFEAFPNRYWIEKVGGASRAQLMAG